MWLFLNILLFLTALVFLYALFLREWLKNQPWATKFMDWIEPAETFLYKKSETLLVARFSALAGAIPAVLYWLGGLDPYTVQSVLGFIDRDNLAIYVPLAFTLIGFASEYLRRKTAKPLDEVEKPRSEGGN